MTLVDGMHRNEIFKRDGDLLGDETLMEVR